MEIHAPWIICRKGKKLFLLAKDEKAYYIIEIGKHLDYATAEWLESQGVSEALLKELQLPFEYIPRKALTCIGLSGCHGGDILHLNLKKGKRVLELAEDVQTAFLKDFFPGILRTSVPKETLEKNNLNWRKTQRDTQLYRKLNWVSVALVFASLLVSFGFYQTDSPIWFTLCLLVLAIPLSLDILMPGYFTIFFTEKNKKPDAWPLEAPLMISLCGLFFAGKINLLDDSAIWRFMAISAAGAALVCLLAEEFRRKPVCLLAAAFVGGLFGSFVLARANEVYAPEEPLAYILEVEDTRVSSGKSTSYYCTVTLPDGREAELSISRSLYNDLEEGGYVRVEVGEGIFRVEYANVYSYEEEG